jgi:hypothetical protein
MYEGIVRILTIAAVCAATAFVVMRLLNAFRREDEIEWEFDLDRTLEELEGHPEGVSSKVWQFETPGPVVTRNVEAA